MAASKVTVQVEPIAKLIGTFDYLLRQCVELFRSYGHEEAAKTVAEYRQKALDEFNRPPTGSA